MIKFVYGLISFVKSPKFDEICLENMFISGEQLSPYKPVL